MEIYWDHIFYARSYPDLPTNLNPVRLKSANLRYRGFSRLYRKGGRYGPHWFDYSEVSKGQKWHDLIGFYTRYGDVRALLEQSDDMYIIMNAGDEVVAEFDAAALPALPKDWKRDFIRSRDYRQRSLNTSRRSGSASPQNKKVYFFHLLLHEASTPAVTTVQSSYATYR